MAARSGGVPRRRRGCCCSWRRATRATRARWAPRCAAEAPPPRRRCGARPIGSSTSKPISSIGGRARSSAVSKCSSARGCRRRSVRGMRAARASSPRAPAARAMLENQRQGGMAQQQQQGGDAAEGGAGRVGGASRVSRLSDSSAELQSNLRALSQSVVGLARNVTNDPRPLVSTPSRLFSLVIASSRPASPSTCRRRACSTPSCASSTRRSRRSPTPASACSR